jgi:hypothetical protein
MIEDKSIPVPSSAVLSQCRFMLDQAYMLHNRRWIERNFSRIALADGAAKPAAWLLADSSPQAGSGAP